ncbi:MAG: methylthioribulose 1-phosphate dehydratase [Synechococcaceae cyanobacterium RL_1_2]|nr:methylthioribulose 1-phosphate dehydratase [Synechococcaceae cyanobacterium RL_1_2]
MNDQGEIWISRSGVDKSKFQPEDFIKVDQDGQPYPEYQPVKPSAETLIHCYVYRHFPKVHCVLHIHSIAATILSGLFLAQQRIIFSGYEVIKGIHGQTTHDTDLALPIFANDQDMKIFCNQLHDRQQELGNYGFLMAKHGLYAWGDSIGAAKRHLEVWEFLLECELELLKIKAPS